MSGRPSSTATRGAVFVAAAVAVLASVAASGCGGRGASSDGADVLRLGCFANVTHLVPLSAAQRHSFEQALAPTRIEWKVFGAGPEAMEALLAGAIDATYVGPGPAEVAFLRSR